MSKSLAVFAATAALFFVARAQADEAAKPADSDPAAMFGQLDTNKDGQLSADEVSEEKKRLFERLVRVADKNGDGKLSSEEFVAGLKPAGKPAAPPSPGDDDKERPGADKLFKRFDANHDGKLTADEVPEKRREMVKAWINRGDKNSDGALTEEELAQVLERGKKLADAKKGEGKRPEGADMARQFFRRLDKNGDGKVTLDELPEERRERFSKLIERADKDGDKALTLEEFAAGARPRQDGPPPGRPDQPPRFGGPGRPPAVLFLALDTDKDGKLSAAEINAAADVLKKLDKDGDGAVTLEEIGPPPNQQ